MTNTQRDGLYKQHQSLVKDEYKCTLDAFCNWIEDRSCECLDYIEIPSNETKAGYAIILDW